LFVAAGTGTGQERPKKEPHPQPEQHPPKWVRDIINAGMPQKYWPENGKVKDAADWDDARDTLAYSSRGRWVRVQVNASGLILRLRDDKGKVLAIQVGPVDPIVDPPGKDQGVVGGHKCKILCPQRQLKFSFPPDAEAAFRNIQPGDMLTIAVPLSQVSI